MQESMLELMRIRSCFPTVLMSDQVFILLTTSYRTNWIGMRMSLSLWPKVRSMASRNNPSQSNSRQRSRWNMKVFRHGTIYTSTTGTTPLARDKCLESYQTVVAPKVHEMFMNGCLFQRVTVLRTSKPTVFVST